MSEFTIETIAPHPVLEVAGRVSAFGIPKLLGNAFPAIAKHVEAAHGTLAGPPFARYLEIDWPQLRNAGPLGQLWQMITGKFSIRAGFATAAPVAGTGTIEAGEFAPGRCVHGTHFGPYHQVGETYKKLAQWADDNGLKLANETFERYVNDPTEVDKSEIETHVFVPIRD